MQSMISDRVFFYQFLCCSWALGKDLQSSDDLIQNIREDSGQEGVERHRKYPYAFSQQAQVWEKYSINLFSRYLIISGYCWAC